MALVAGGLAAAFTVVTVGLINRPLRDYHAPSEHEGSPEVPSASPAQAADAGRP
jgi:hypothetical protein